MRFEQRLLRRERRRRQRQAAKALLAPISACPDPGPLLHFIPKVSPQFRAPVHLSAEGGRNFDLIGTIERGIDAPGSVTACFSIPPRHTKTSTLQHAVAWILAKKPTSKILYCCYAHGFAARNVWKAREYAQRAGVRLGGARRREYWETAAGGFVKAAGIGGQITGEGFDWVIVDDPHKSRAEAESRTIREGVIEAFYNDILTRLEPNLADPDKSNTNFLIVHARWHVNDLIGVLTHPDPTRPEFRPFDRHNAVALDENDGALAPWLFGAEVLKKQRASLGPYAWASLFQGEPRPRGGSLFHNFHFAAFQTPRRFRIAIGLDLAHKASTQSDHNAAVVMRADMETPADERTIDVLEAHRARGSLSDHEIERLTDSGERERVLVDEGFVQSVARLCTRYPTAEPVIYAADAELAVVTLFERLLTKKLGRKVRVNVIRVLAGDDKYQRAMAYAASCDAGRVRLPGRPSVHDGHTRRDEHLLGAGDDGRDRDHWVNDFSNEHVNFTGKKGEEDDQVDAAAAAHDHLCKAGGKVGFATSGAGTDSDRLARVT